MIRDLLESARNEEGIAHIIWAGWNSGIIESWDEVCILCSDYGIVTIDKYWK